MRRLIINGENALQFHNDNMNKINPIAFAKYYSPSCPACIAMSDEWDNMTSDIEQNYDTDLAVVDIDPSGMNILEKTSTHSDVDYVPSLVILSNGNKIKQYQGSRETDQMIQFLLEEGHIRRKNKDYSVGLQQAYSIPSKRSKTKRSKHSKRIKTKRRRNTKISQSKHI